jgi:predicted transcriptional regulator
MPAVKHTIELDADTDERLRSLATERGQNAADVIADAIALLSSTIDFEELDLEEDLRRVRKFERTGEAIPLDEVKGWVESWGTANERPRPQPRKLR